METGQREDHKDGVSPLRKYIRFQQIGCATIVAWPVGIMIASMFGLDYLVPQISVLVVYIGVTFFAIGHVGRQELRKERTTKTNGNDRPK